MSNYKPVEFKSNTMFETKMDELNENFSPLCISKGIKETDNLIKAYQRLTKNSNCNKFEENFSQLKISEDLKDHIFKATFKKEAIKRIKEQNLKVRKTIEYDPDIMYYPPVLTDEDDLFDWEIGNELNHMLKSIHLYRERVSYIY